MPEVDKRVVICEETNGLFSIASGHGHMEMVKTMTQRDRTVLWVPATNQYGEDITLIVSPAFLKADVSKLMRTKE